MRKYCLFILSAFLCKPLLSQKTVLLETKYYSFQSNAQLNAHLNLYNRAITCKIKKVAEDSLAYFSFKEKLRQISPSDLKALNGVLRFYKDSLTNKDLLFDSLMRDLSDRITDGTLPKQQIQIRALEQLKTFQPIFNKLYWKEIEAENKSWILANKVSLVRQEVAVVPELEKIYQSKLPDGRVIVDLTCYATWAGAFSYHDGFCHVLFASSYGNNRGELATEVVFHETSHFLIDKIEAKLKVLTKGKDIRKHINLWHNIIFYTTGFVMEKQNAAEGKLYLPYYVQMKFEDKFPDFKATVEACKTHWDPYINGQSELDDALKSIVNYIQERK